MMLRGKSFNNCIKYGGCREDRVPANVEKNEKEKKKPNIQTKKKSIVKDIKASRGPSREKNLSRKEGRGAWGAQVGSPM